MKILKVLSILLRYRRLVYVLCLVLYNRPLDIQRARVQAVFHSQVGSKDSEVLVHNLMGLWSMNLNRHTVKPPIEYLLQWQQIFHDNSAVVFGHSIENLKVHFQLNIIYVCR